MKPEITPASAAVTSADARRASNVRTAWILASIALVFFGGIIFAQYSNEPTVSMSVLGLAIFGFLLVAIGRNVRK